MKKTISALIVFLLLLATQGVSLNVYAKEYLYLKGAKQIEKMAVEINAVIDEYDADIICETIDAKKEPITEDGLYSENDFVTSRLIVRTYKDVDEYGATCHIDGYDNINVLQYDSPSSALAAYEKYCDDESVISAQPDLVIKLDDYYASSDFTPSSVYDYDDTMSVEHSWGYDRIQTEEAFNYILKNKAISDLPEITVGIIDDGIGYYWKNDEFKNRVIKLYSFLEGNYLGHIEQTGNHGAFIANIIFENTLPNVKFISYQCFDDEGGKTSLVLLAMEQAKLDGVDIVNCSFSHAAGSGDTLVNKDLEIPNDEPLIIAAAGNSRTTNPFVPAANKNSISVAASTDTDEIAYYSNYGDYVDVVAPGSNIKAYTNLADESLVPYNVGSGTSFSAPYVVSICAMIMTQFPSFNNSAIADVLFNSCESLQNEYIFGQKISKHGLVNMFNAVTYYETGIRLTATPQFNIDSHPSNAYFYDDTITVELSCSDPNSEIFYTTDNKKPSKTNGNRYTQPIEISTTTNIIAVAYSNDYVKSEFIERTFYVKKPLSSYPNENGWHIRDNGMIWGYSGNDTDLVVPNIVLDIEVKGIEESAFQNQNYITSITMPDCLETIEDYAFYNCLSLRNITAPGVKRIGEFAFSNCINLNDVYFPELQEIGEESFSCAGALEHFPFENLVTVPTAAFYGSEIMSAQLSNAKIVRSSAFCYSKIQEVSLPVVESMGDTVFDGCTMLKTVDINSALDELPMNCFSNCEFSRIDFLDNICYIGAKTFAYNYDLSYVCLPSLLSVNSQAFYDDYNLYQADLPNAKTIKNNAFYGCKSLSLVQLSDDLRKLEGNAFYGCDKLKTIMLYGNFTNYANTFDNCSIQRLEMNKVETLKDLPDTENCIIAMPSTFTECTDNTQGRNYLVYGSAGTYAEQWANENGHQFIDVSQDTAIVQDVDEQYDGTGELTFDCIGFNKTYTWYGSNSADTSNGVELYSDSKGSFNPREFVDYPYYYCVCTSNDRNESIGFEHTEVIFSRVSENTCYVELYGDVDENGVLDINDIGIILSASVGEITISKRQTLIADINKDGVVDAFDAAEVDQIVYSVNTAKGDVNQDGNTDLADYAMTKAHISGVTVDSNTPANLLSTDYLESRYDKLKTQYPEGTIITQQYYCADIDSDKAVDAFDLFYIDKRLNQI